MPLLTSAEAAARLGVKPATLYAYVSRGLVARVPGPDQRSSRFDADEIAALAARRRPRIDESTGNDGDGRGVGGFSVVSGVTLLGPDVLRYRGRDAAACARTMTFEAVAEWLWTGNDGSPVATWTSDLDTVALAAKVGRLLPSSALLPDHLRVMTAVVGAADPMRFDPRPEAFMAATRTLLSTLVDALPVRRPGGVPRLHVPTTDRLGQSSSSVEPRSRAGDDGHIVTNSLAARLWIRLSALRPSGGDLNALNAALVLLADHELATSTFGVRVAASTRADPYACIATGLGVLAGPLHGSASAAVHQLFVSATQQEGPTAAVAALLRRGDRVPGFGHALYPSGDPRATELLAIVRASEPNRRRMAIVDGVLSAIARRQPISPNVDFSLGALAFVAMMPADAGETIFAIARSAGWIAHALEEMREPPLRYRIRARPSS